MSAKIHRRGAEYTEDHAEILLFFSAVLSVLCASAVSLFAPFLI